MGKWDEYLTRLADGTKKCNLCDKRFNMQKDGNTNVYLNHFKKFHSKEFQKVRKFSSEIVDSSDGPPPKKVSRQIDQFFSEYSENGIKTMEIQRAVTQLISTAALPLSLVEHPGFKNLLRITTPRFHLKSRSQFTRSELPKLHEEYKTQLKNSLASVDDISLSFDCWTDSARKHEYLAFIVHYVENNKPVYRILEVIDVSEERHTAVFLADKMKAVIDFFDLSSKIRACVRDGAPNAKSASLMICDVNFDCFAHKLNLAAKAGTAVFPGLENVLVKLKKTCKAIRMSSNLRRDWEKIFDQLESPVLMLKKHIDVRWTSLNEVLKRAICVRDELDLFLQDEVSLEEITDAEWKTVQAVIDLLKPLDIAFSLVQEKGFTCSSVIPLCKVIIADLETKKKNLTAKGKIVEKLTAELEKYEGMEYLNLATLLDVRFKSEYVKDDWKEKLLEVMLNTIDEAEEVSVVNVTEPKPESNPFTRFVSSSSTKTKKVQSDKRSVIVGEHDRWITDPTDDTMSPFEFWSLFQNQHAFPTLFKLQKKYFCSPATSVETERLFSTARIVLTDNRKCLSAKNFSMLLFLQRNIPLMGY